MSNGTKVMSITAGIGALIGVIRVISEDEGKRQAYEEINGALNEVVKDLENQVENAKVEEI